ncbi:MAG TPA: YigZ family protein, partial [Dysgonamonadaceae bacterium]|nr:YigZ family protein [Dysgonamonadaceae bacterium]
IHAAGLTDVLVIVVRYFGGILLGTSGLIKAYKEAAAQAIANAEIVEKTVDDTLVIRFPYLLLNDVMRVLKQVEGIRWDPDFAEDCTVTVHVRKSQSDRLFGILSQIYGVEVAYL